MAVTFTTLRVRYPEFVPTPEALITASIVDAELMVDRTVYGSKSDMAVTSYAAHLIAINPLGEMARLDKKSDKTTYLLAFNAIKRSTAAGFRVI